MSKLYTNLKLNQEISESLLKDTFNLSMITCFLTLGVAFVLLSPDVFAVTSEGAIEGFKSSADKIIGTVKGIVLPVVMWAGFGLGAAQMMMNRMKQGAITAGVGVIAKMAESVIGETYTLMLS